MENKHIPVLKTEAIDALITEFDNSTYIDTTLGGGGYSQEMLSKLSNSTVLSLDLELEAINKYTSGKKFNKTSDNIWQAELEDNKSIVMQANFSELEAKLNDLDVKNVNGVVADLGWSTEQLERIEGLSFENNNASLDMRFDTNKNIDAKDILNVSAPDYLVRLFVHFGDVSEKLSKKLVVAIKEAGVVTTVGDLNKVIENFDNSYKLRSQVFQALRIAVNNEYENLTQLVEQSAKLLKNGGRLVVVTFHSGEDSILESAIKAQNGILKQVGKIQRPSIAELKANLRARSAKLYTYEKHEN